MAPGGEKKRKRQNEGSSKSSKKVAFDTMAAEAKVTSVTTSAFPPVVVSTHGFSYPKDLTFTTYDRVHPTTKKLTKDPRTGQTEMMLQSSEHPRIDYEAREIEPLVRHYVGILDPKSGEMQVVPARRMEMKALVRSRALAETADGKTNMDRRNDLTQAFGTKKAKKALNDKINNAIGPKYNKDGEKEINALDNASKAMLSQIGEVTSTMASRDDLQAAVVAAKPVPKANLEADSIEAVYDPKSIIGADILSQVPVLEWQEKAKHGEGIKVPSRFVASRVNHIASNSHATERLRVLRYFLLVLQFYLSTKPGSRGVRKVAPRDKLRELLAPAPEPVVENIRRRFSEGGEMRKYHIDLLMTHMCVFACVVDQFEVDTQTLVEDLRVQPAQLNQYFAEIGARVKQVANKEVKGAKKSVARLALPLEFPKQRVMAQRRK